MSRYLVVANQTLGSRELVAELAARRDRGPSTFHLLVPVTHPSGAWAEGQVQAAATQRLEDGMRDLKAQGFDVEAGETGDVSPVRAIGDVLLHDEFDEIILSTLPPGPSRWLHQDVPHRVSRTYKVPMTHVVAHSVPVPTG
jgi:GABA permease